MMHAHAGSTQGRRSRRRFRGKSKAPAWGEGFWLPQGLKSEFLTALFRRPKGVKFRDILYKTFRDILYTQPPNAVRAGGESALGEEGKDGMELNT
jgi:hypothetical protein